MKFIHCWFSLILGCFLILWAISGIVLNHRSLVASYEIPRKWLGDSYEYQNWNFASVRSGFTWEENSLILYGNVGIWLTDVNFQHYEPLMDGIPDGLDNRKIFKILKTPKGHCYAGTQSGLYYFQPQNKKWLKIGLDLHDERVLDLAYKEQKLFVLTRSELFYTEDIPQKWQFSLQSIPASSEDDGKTSLFRTLWLIHSGEIFGRWGKLAVDFLALVMVFLCITGYVYYFFPGWISRRKKKALDNRIFLRISRFCVKWHKKAGLMLGIFLLLVVVTGMFLRPPLLIPVASQRVPKMPFSTLSNDNPWYDSLRTIHWNSDGNYWLLGSSRGFFVSDPDFSKPILPIEKQPPVSVMGINVMEYLGRGAYLVGSFTGIFIWHVESGFIQDYIRKTQYHAKNSIASPMGEYMISGMLPWKNRHLLFDYRKGLLYGDIPMPSVLQNQGMPLWNFALEVHTGRIFQGILGQFYILVIPLLGLATCLILLSGFVLQMPKLKLQKKH